MRTWCNRFAFLGLSLLLVACGKDQNVEDYQRQKLQQNLALYQEKEGIYTGLVRSKRDGSVIGAMEISFSAQTRTRPSNDGQLSIGSPTLVANVRFLDRNVIDLTSSEGFYDPSTNLYHADIPIARSSLGGSGNASPNGPSPAPGQPNSPNGNGGGYGNTPVPPGGGLAAGENVTISGQLTQGTLVGEVQSQNYPEYGGRLELVRGGEDIRSLLAKVRPGDRRREEETAERVTSFSGNTIFRGANNSEDQPNRPVRVTLTRQSYNTSEDFLDLISPIKVVQLAYNYSDSLRILFPKAIFDTRQGYVTAQTLLSLNGQSNQMTVDCHQDNSDLTCTHLTSGGGVAATTRASLDNGNAPNPPDRSRELKSITKTFVGSGEFYPGQPRRMTMAVTFPARTRFQELIELFFPISEYYLQVALRFTESTSASFVNVKWDSNSGFLDGSVERSGSGSYVQQVQCTNFYFTATKDPFSCSFWSSRSPVITINFTPPFGGRDDRETTPDPSPRKPVKKKRPGRRG